ncbi:hypothetical protein G5B40_19305 [Pikeienuella piscinae]|uniref:Uncharacterized protein n=1 Tax=Pikeienuella piscinae TaxID=2748098 RepID=A0A7M3T5X2_9RHOB|nr:hypothetical protein [Pikeienuella piscinae]QIE57403.1 hypothetical protein G5B40_19305 [Pikeienuella piscinae]
MTAEFDKQFALAECGELRALIIKYVEIVTATERFALAGAAALAAFSVSGITPEIERARIFISALPLLILSLAGLRCLTFYFVIKVALAHVERVERAMLTEPALGLQRNAKQTGPFTINRAIEVVSGGFWSLGIVAALIFWLVVNDLI